LREPLSNFHEFLVIKSPAKDPDSVLAFYAVSWHFQSPGKIAIVGNDEQTF